MSVRPKSFILQGPVMLSTSVAAIFSFMFYCSSRGTTRLPLSNESAKGNAVEERKSLCVQAEESLADVASLAEDSQESDAWKWGSAVS